MSRGPAVVATALALTLINAGLAALIVEAVGARALVPLWVSLALVVLGVVAAVGAVTLWRGYLNSVRGPSPEP